MQEQTPRRDELQNQQPASTESYESYESYWLMHAGNRTMMADSRLDHMTDAKPNFKKHMNSFIYDLQAGEIICSCCGTVVEEKLADSESSERGSTYTAAFHRPVHITMHDFDLGSVVSGNSTISKAMQKYFKDSTRDSRKKRIFTLFMTVDKICKKHAFSKRLQETICSTLRVLEKRRMIQDVSREPLVWALVFVSLEIAGRRMPAREFLAKYVGKSQHKSFKRHVQKIRAEMKIVPDARQMALYYLRLRAPSMTRSKAIRSAAEEIVLSAYQKGHSDGRDPRVVAASALYTACKTHRFSSTLAETAGLFKVSVGAMQRCRSRLSAGSMGEDSIAAR